jgi:hypothetical protein
MSQGQMIAGAGGVVLIISVFLDWVAGRSAWDAFSIVHVIMLLIGIAAVAFAVLPAASAAVTLPAGLPLLIAALGIAAFGFAAGWELEISGGIGVWLAVIGSLAIAYGAYDAAGAPVRRATRSRRTTSTPTPPPAV